MKGFQDFLDNVDMEQLALSIFEDCSDEFHQSRELVGEELTLQRAKEIAAFSLISLGPVLALYHEWLAHQIDQIS